MNSITLLLVDDNPANLAVLYDHLQTQGYRVLVTDNGIDAVEQVNDVRPDLVLLDVRMPGMDGYETCRAIKSNKENANLPIMFLSALSDLDDRLKGFEAGAVDYVTKPLDALEVAARIRTHVTVGQLQQQLADQNEKLEEMVVSRTAELQTANHSLQSEIKRTRQQQREKARLLTLLEEQNQQLRSFTDWLLKSRPEVQIELTHMISSQLLRNWVAVGSDLSALSRRMKRLKIDDEELSNIIAGIRLRNDKVELYLRQMLNAGQQIDETLLDSVPPEPAVLSEREQEILIMLCDGLSTTDVARQLSISNVTIRTHRTRIMQKLDIYHLPGLVKYAIKHSLTDLQHR